VLLLVPGYISYIAGDGLARARSADRPAQRLALVGLSASFVAGFSTVFVALGAGATALGQLLLRYKYEANIVVGIIVVVFGLFLIGVLNISWLQRDLRVHADSCDEKSIPARLVPWRRERHRRLATWLHHTESGMPSRVNGATGTYSMALQPASER
jgi:cytochrome c-type biogenesis protein